MGGVDREGGIRDITLPYIPYFVGDLWYTMSLCVYVALCCRYQFLLNVIDVCVPTAYMNGGAPKHHTIPAVLVAR